MDCNIMKMNKMALKVREHIIDMAVGEGCFLGAAFSCTDLLVFLYSHYLKVKAKNLDDPNRDYLFLSKGHAVPALYGTLAEVGLLATERLKNHLLLQDSIYWHPNPKVAGIEFHSGSLGHGLPLAVGVAIDCSLCGQQNRIVVITGDGELNEGSNWEALLAANPHRLDHLIVIVDRNQFQANARTEELIPMEPLRQKFEAFGCAVDEVDGHDYEAMVSVFSRIPFAKGKINVVLANTIRGRGLPSLTAREDCWFVGISSDEREGLRKELQQFYVKELSLSEV